MLVPAQSRKNALDQAATEFTINLLASENDCRYWAERGIDADLIVKYRIGLVGKDCSLDWKQYVGRYSIPYLTRSGVVTLRFRRNGNDDGGPKYLSLPGDVARLYNVGVLLHDGTTLAITEGEIDAVTLTEYAGIPAIGVPGVANWKPVFNRLVGNYDRVLCVGDGDDAGRSFAETLAEELEAVPVFMPDGYDVNTYWMEHGPMELRELLES